MLRDRFKTWVKKRNFLSSRRPAASRIFFLFKKNYLFLLFMCMSAFHAWVYTIIAVWGTSPGLHWSSKRMPRVTKLNFICLRALGRNTHILMVIVLFSHVAIFSHIDFPGYFLMLSPTFLCSYSNIYSIASCM